MKLWTWTEHPYMGDPKVRARIGTPCRPASCKKHLHPNDFYATEFLDEDAICLLGVDFAEREADKIIKRKIEQFIKDEVPKKIESLRQERAEIERMIEIADSMAPSAVRSLKNVIADLDKDISDLEWYLPL